MNLLELLGISFKVWAGDGVKFLKGVPISKTKSKWSMYHKHG